MKNRAPSIAVLVITGLILRLPVPWRRILKLGSRVQSRTVTLKWERLPIRYTGRISDRRCLCAEFSAT